MPISIHDVSVPVFVRGLNNLSGLLKKGAAHATARKIDPSALLTARLFPDMLAFTRQVQMTADFAKITLARIAGIEAPKNEDKETGFDELGERVKGTLAFVQAIDKATLEAGATKDVTFPVGGGQTMTLPALPYLLHFGMPNFYFHLTTAYDILRHNGVEVGKRDFIGSA